LTKLLIGQPRFWAVFTQNNQIGQPGVNVIILKIFSPKLLKEILALWAQITARYLAVNKTWVLIKMPFSH
jgi:hypothetical protein